MTEFKFNPRKNIDGPGSNTNGKRARRGKKSIQVYDKYDPESNVTDTLADIFHYCDREGIDVEHVLDRARFLWEEER